MLTGYQGLIRPTEDSYLLQILENYIPTVLATLLEPFWVVLNRFLCVLQPFKDMRDKKRRPHGSVYSNYTSIPPQLTVFRALRSRHFFLAMVCSVALLANVLAVSFSGLFRELPTEIQYNVQVKPLIASRFNDAVFKETTKFLGQSGYTYADHAYVTLANYTTNTTLPPWISPEFYFQPFQTVYGTTDNTTEKFKSSTRGYGYDSNCITMESSSQPPALDFRAFKSEYNLTNEANCNDTFQPPALSLTQHSARSSSGKLAVEFSKSLSLEEAGPAACRKALIFGWGRTSDGQDQDATVESSFVVCYPQFRTAMFDVRVDGSGYVESYNRTSDFESSLKYPEFQNHSNTLILLHNSLLLPTPEWHNDSLTRSWMDHFIKLRLNSTALVDPDAPVPKAEDVLPSVEDIYRRLFALLIGLNSKMFEASDETTAVAGLRLVQETRIFIPFIPFIISLAILGIDLLTAILFYGFATKSFLPQIPTTIVSVMAYLAPSYAVREFDRRVKMYFGFGIFVGVDGGRHVGIEKEQLVAPVKV